MLADQTPATHVSSSAWWLWLSKILVFLFHCLVAVTPFVFTWVNEELFEFNKMLTVYVFTVLIVGVWVAKMAVAQKLIWRRTSLDIPIGLFLLSQILATIFSMHLQTSIFGYYTRFHGGLLSTICYILLYYAATSNLTKRDLIPLWATTFLSAALVSIYAIPEHFGHSPSCWLITQSMPGQIPAFDVSCWVQDVQSRIFGTFGQPNWLAAYAITLIPLGLVLSFPSSSKSTLAKVLPYLASLTTGLLTWVLIFTQSRSGFLGLAAGLGALAIGLSLGWVSQHGFTLPPGKSKSLWLIPVVLLFMVGSVGFFGTPYSPSISQLLASQSATNPVTTPDPAPTGNSLDTGGSHSAEIRKIVWWGAYQVWQRYPIFGSGVETFAYSYYLDRPMDHNLVSEWDFLYNKAHNEFLNYLATTGLVGFTAVVLLLGWYGVSSGWHVLFNRHLETFDRSVITALASGILALSVSNALGFSTVMVSVLMYLGFATFDILLRGKFTALDTQPAPQRQATLSAVQGLGLATTVLVMGYLCMLISTTWRADYFFSQGKAAIRSSKADLALFNLEKAIDLSPREGLFYDELAATSGQIAVAFGARGDSTASAQFADLAYQASDQALLLNPHQINFYRTRIRVDMMLAQLDPTYWSKAKSSVLAVIPRAPTDPKLVYNLGVIEKNLGNSDAAIAALEQAITMKSNYETARYELGQLYQHLNQPAAAQTQYQYILNNINPANVEVQAALKAVTASISAERSPN